MSSNAAAAKHFGAPHTESDAKEECDDFFAWAEVEHRKNTMSVDEAASLLGVSVDDAHQMISDGALCANLDYSTGFWLVKTLCIRAQLAESVPLATEGNTSYSGYQTVAQNRAINIRSKHNPFPGIDLNDTIAARRLIAQHKEEHKELIKSSTIVAPHTVAPANEADSKVLSSLDELFDTSPLASTDPAPIATSPKEKKQFDRAEVTAKNIEALMDSLDFANVRLEGSMYRIGYLEAQVNSLESQMTVMNEYRNRAATAILTDRENAMLKQTNASLYMHNEALEVQIFNLQHNLETANILLTKIEQTWWYKLCAWLFRFKIEQEPPRALKT